MNKIAFTIFLSLLAFPGAAKGSAPDQPLMQSANLVWAGLDYSMMRFICDTNLVKVPDLLFQNMPERWNDLFLDERIEGVADALQRRISIDISGVTKRNRHLNKSQISSDVNKRNDFVLETQITSIDISNAVKTLEMENQSGLGLIFIVDRFVSQTVMISGPSTGPNRGVYTPMKKNSGAIYVVFFDIASREVLSATREVRTVSTGGSFRNFWFGPIKEVDRDLAKFKLR